MCNILIIYRSNTYPLRANVWDHLYSFQRYSKHRCFYLNLENCQTPLFFEKIEFHLIIFHTIFLSARWSTSAFEKLVNKAERLKQVNAVKIALPQDEFFKTDVLCDFINEFGIDCVFSVAPKSEWPKIYPTVDFQRVKFFNVLTGYLDETTVSRINTLARSVQTRTVDIGYRAWRAASWLGRHGLLKAQVADVFLAKGPRKGLIVDISTRIEDTFLGDEWYKFLLRCKYTIGVEGGASILDLDGTIRQRTERYLVLHPQAELEEIEAACFPNLEGSLQLFAISPRHLEACATRTCQVLIEGAYNGVLIAGQHYIELKRDWSNIDQVLDLIKQNRLRDEITERAYHDVVESGRYTYKSFVEFILEHSLGNVKPKELSVMESVLTRCIYLWMRLADILSWGKVAFSVYLSIPRIKGIVRKILVDLFSEEIVAFALRRLKGR